MGSSGRRRGRRTRSDHGGARTDIREGVGFPEFEHNQWTFEGQIERLGAFARGSQRVTGWRRRAAVVLALVFVAPLVIGLVSMVLSRWNTPEPPEVRTEDVGSQPIADLDAPTVGGPDNADLTPIAQSLDLVDCDKASDHVGGALASTGDLVTGPTARICYTELPDETTRRYAGALIVPHGFDPTTQTMADLFAAGGIWITATRPAEHDPAELLGSDPHAPGGGYAAFAIDPATIGRVVRVNHGVHAIFVTATLDGSVVSMTVTADRSPDEVVELARAIVPPSAP